VKTSEKVGKTPELPRSHRESLALLAKMRASMLDGGGKDRQARQKAKGKKTARERIQYLVDGGSFVENQPYELSRIDDFGMDSKKISGDGVITGSALVEGRPEYGSEDGETLGSNQ
jgi:propionyl-CoA carboxylase beta chain